MDGWQQRQSSKGRCPFNFSLAQNPVDTRGFDPDPLLLPKQADLADQLSVWYYGEALCKIVQYSWLFSSHLMSFAIVCIALDRVRTVYRLMHIEKNGKVPRSSATQLAFVKRLIVAAYVISAVLSVPQFHVWRVIEGENFSQCTTIWHYERASKYEKNPENYEMDVYPLERFYTLFHLLTVFWIPFLMLFCAYLYIVVYLFWYSLKPYSLSTGSPRFVKHSCEVDSNENLSLWNNCAPTSPVPVSTGSIKSGKFLLSSRFDML
uniref:G-protein coupled receptors family 1 profile domain-containing protein n=1 Tax=Panagrolaimus sp. JU765 TaxID=591449 RepID=A0AC34R9J6_9BILA